MEGPQFSSLAESLTFRAAGYDAGRALHHAVVTAPAEREPDLVRKLAVIGGRVLGNGTVG